MQKPFSQVGQKVEVPYQIIWLGLTAKDRDILKKRIRERVSIQLDEGLLEEVRTIYMQFGATQTIMNAITYKEYIKHLEGNYSLDQAFEESVMHTNILARRQLTWFRANLKTTWIEIDEKNSDQLFDQCMIEISKKMIS
jgi:tRNA dimethylallyltransferase